MSWVAYVLGVCVQELKATSPDPATDLPSVFILRLLEEPQQRALAALCVFPAAFPAAPAAAVMAMAAQPSDARSMLTGLYLAGVLMYNAASQYWQVVPVIREACAQHSPAEVIAAEMRYITYYTDLLQQLGEAYYKPAEWRNALMSVRMSATDIVSMAGLAGRSKSGALALGKAMSPAAASMLLSADVWRMFEDQRLGAARALLSPATPVTHGSAFLHHPTAEASVADDVEAARLMDASYSQPLCTLLISSKYPADKALEICKALLGLGHAVTAWACANAASALRSQGKRADAEPMQRNALSLRTLALGAEHPDSLASISLVAMSLVDQGKHPDAEEMCRQAVQLCTRVLGADHPDTASSISSLAVSLKGQGRQADALPLHRQALEMRAAAMGMEHPLTIASVNNLAGCLKDTKQYSEAEQMYRQALDLRSRVLGTQHTDTIASLNNLGICLGLQGKHDDAEQVYRQALSLRAGLLGWEAPATIASINNLAICLNSQVKRPSTHSSIIQNRHDFDIVIWRSKWAWHSDQSASLQLARVRTVAHRASLPMPSRSSVRR